MILTAKRRESLKHFYKETFQTTDVYIVTTLALFYWLATGASAQPACDGPSQRLLDHAFFQICYDTSVKAPVWTGYELGPEHLGHPSSRRFSFRRDPLLVSQGASNADFRSSGFSRGHMIPAIDFAGSEAAEAATYYLSNVVAQKQRINAGLWRRLENAVRRIAAASGSVSIFTGPLFESDNLQYIGPGRVAVPTHTYKVVLAIQGRRMTMFAAIIPNETNANEPLNHYAVSVDEVERRTGLDFFRAVEDSLEDVLEAAREYFPASRPR